MRRIVLMAVAASALALAAPGVASAHHSRHHHRSLHARKARVRHFGSVANSTAPTTTGSVTPAGKVKSFNEGVLTITLADESTVSGKVTEDTELRCLTPGSGGGDDEGDDRGDSTRAVMSDHHGDGVAGDSQGDDDQGGGDDHPPSSTCTATALTPGATVLGAELRIGPGGAVWEEIVLSA
jgi:hypothetical protein